MSAELFRMKEWLDTLQLLVEFCEEPNRDDTSKFGQMYSILGIIYQDRPVLDHGNKLIESLDFHYQLISYRTIALQLYNNPHLREKSLVYINQVLELLSEYLQSTKNKEYSDYISEIPVPKIGR